MTPRVWLCTWGARACWFIGDAGAWWNRVWNRAAMWVFRKRRDWGNP